VLLVSEDLDEILRTLRPYRRDVDGKLALRRSPRRRAPTGNTIGQHMAGH
jgi:hypothetical protein